MDDKTNPPPKPQDIARLLEWATEVPEPTDPADPSREQQDKSDALYDLLETPLSMDDVLAQMLPDVLARVCTTLEPLAHATLGQLLQNPQIDLVTVEQIKQYAKRLTRSNPSGPIHAAATVVYYAAIANALVHHDKRITTRAPERLAQALQQIEQLPWLESDLVGLFQRASALCATDTQESK